MNDLDTAVEYITPGNISLEKGMLMNDFSLISNEFEIRNPDELYEFIKDKEGFIELINKSLDFFKAYYPNSTYTLEYIDYLEGYEFNIIFCFISDDDSFDIDLYDKLSDDFTDLIFQFEDIKKYYSFCID